MFSQSEKKYIARTIENMLLALNHPEMPKEKPVFHLHVEGNSEMSWADIKPNWTYDENNKPGINSWNERAREILGGKDEH